MYTFTVTIALEDDTGTTYDAEYAERWALTISKLYDAEVFSIAHGRGIDTETNQTEPVLILQGSVPEAEAYSLVTEYTLFARDALNQRAIGWFIDETGGSYVPVSPRASNRRYYVEAPPELPA